MLLSKFVIVQTQKLAARSAAVIGWQCSYTCLYSTHLGRWEL